MIRHRLHIIFLLLFCFLLEGVVAQTRARASVDRTTILVGEPIKLSIDVTVPATSHFNWFTIDTIPHFEFITKGRVDSSQQAAIKTYHQELTITSYDSGYWTIPSFRLSARLKLKTDTLPINVTYSAADPNQPYHDIKEIIPVKEPSDNYLFWILGIITLLFAIAAFFYLRKKKPVKAMAQVVSKLSPYEEAMKLLDELAKEHPQDNAQVKNYFIRINDVLRVYLRRRFNYSTVDKTNEELILQLRKSKLTGEHFSDLAQALRMTDFVKFAKYIPSESAKQEVLMVIKNSIKLLEELNKSAQDAV
jgi:hypothetical protein